MWRRWVLLLVVFAITAAIAWPVLFQVALWISPNRTSDGYVVMPMGQVAFAFAASPVVGLLIARAVGRRVGRRA